MEEAAIGRPALRLSASQMVPSGELAGIALADPPLPAQFTEPRGAQEPRAAACSAKEGGCPAQSDGSQAWQAPGSGLCLQPPEKVQVRRLSSSLPELLCTPANPASLRGRGGVSSEASPHPTGPESRPCLTLLQRENNHAADGERPLAEHMQNQFLHLKKMETSWSHSGDEMIHCIW